MNKLLLCVAILAMSYIASADVPTYALPLISTDATQGEIDYLSMSCETTDSKFYYADFVNASYALIRSWDSSSHDSSSINVTTGYIQLSNFTSTLVAGASYTTVLKCIGTGAYVALAYANSTDGTNNGIELFAAQGDTVVSTYSLPLNDSSIVKDAESFLTQSCQTSDGKFYYADSNGTSGGDILRVWDSDSQSITNNISMTAVEAAVIAFVASVGDISKLSPALQCLGKDVYIALPWQNSTATGIQTFLVQTTVPVPNYTLPLNLVPSKSSDWLTQSCTTTNGKLYYGDGDVTTMNVTLQTWDASSQGMSSIALNNILPQVIGFLNSTAATAEQSTLSCIGNDVYMNFVWTNGTTTGIELFLLTKASGIVSFSFGALFVAIVALLF